MRKNLTKTDQKSILKQNLPAFAVTRIPGKRSSVIFFCPFCLVHHRHGIPEERYFYPEHRVAHCEESVTLKANGYFIYLIPSKS